MEGMVAEFKVGSKMCKECGSLLGDSTKSLCLKCVQKMWRGLHMRSGVRVAIEFEAGYSAIMDAAYYTIEGSFLKVHLHDGEVRLYPCHKMRDVSIRTLTHEA